METKVVMFAGAWGCGSTFLTKYIALILSRSGKNTALIDTSEKKGLYFDICYNTKESDTKGLLKLAEGYKDSGAVALGEKLDLYTIDPYQKNKVESKDIIKGIGEIKESGLYDIIIIDSCLSNARSYMDAIDEIILVQDLKKENALHLYYELTKNIDISNKSIELVINKDIYCKADINELKKIIFKNSMTHIQEIYIPFSEENYITDLNNKECNTLKTKKFTKDLKKSLYFLCTSITNIDHKLSKVI